MPHVLKKLLQINKISIITPVKMWTNRNNFHAKKKLNYPISIWKIALQWHATFNFPRNKWFLELLILSTFAIISSLILKSAVSSVLGTSGFYIISRLMGFFSANIAFSYDNGVDKIITNFSYGLMKIISTLFPRLDLFAQKTMMIWAERLRILLVLWL